MSTKPPNRDRLRVSRFMAMLSLVMVPFLAACDSSSNDTTLQPLAEDGAVFYRNLIGLCDKDINNSGYGVCGSISLHPEGWTGYFSGVLYEDGEQISLDDTIPFVINWIEFHRESGEPKGVPRYDVALEAEAEDEPISVEVSGYVDAVVYGNFVFMAGSLEVHAYGQALDLTLTPVNDGGSEPESEVWLEESFPTELRVLPGALPPSAPQIFSRGFSCPT